MQMHSNFDDEAFLNNPSKFGFCSFDEFRKNKDRWSVPKDQILQVVDKGSTAYKMKIREQKYFLEGYPCDSLEKVEELANEMGILPKDLKVGGIHRVKVDNGKECLRIHFMSSQTIEKRKTW